MKDKVLRLHSAFSVKADGGEDAIHIEGYASTTDIDRHGDVVPSTVWEKGIKNYLRNPVILAYHDHSKPIGRMTEHKIDKGGLWIKARISAAADIYKLVKDNIITAFSIGFRVLDAEYNDKVEAFLIKDLELVEISVVSVPANQNTLFQLSKAFETPEEYEEFKKHFAPKGESAKGLESTTEAKGTTSKEWKMDPKELQQMLADAAKAAAEEATKALEARQKAQEEARAAEAARQAEIDARVKAAVEAQVTVGKSGTEKLLEEIEKRLQDQEAAHKNALSGLEASLKEKAEELSKLQASKMTFGDKKAGDNVTIQEKEIAVLMSKVTGKSIADTRYGKTLIQKAGPHVGAGTVNANGVESSLWETEVSLNMENEVRRRLVVAPLVRSVQMQTSIMRMPLNPEAGKATWVQSTAYGTDNSSGTADTHQLSEVTLSAYKLATKEFLQYEEEEDSLLILLPVVRDAMVRRMARAIDAAMINGVGNGTTDPIKGLAMYDASSVVTIDSSVKATIANMRAMRKDLGAWGLDPREIVYVVNTEVYYNLLDDADFLTVDKIGDRATLLTGQIGSIANSPVLVSGEFPTIAESTAGGSTNVAAFCFAPSNFVVGVQRGLRVETDTMVEKQSRILVATQRLGMTQLTTNLGAGVSTLRYVNV